MKIAPFPKNESERIETIQNLQILDTEEEEIYNDAVALVAKLLNVPIALVSIVDTNRQWFKAKVGLEAKQTPRDLAFCAHAILQEEPLIVEDATLDDRFFDNPLVQDGVKIRFYIGSQIETKKGIKVGTLCAIDTVPRKVTDEEIHCLKIVSKQVSSYLELRAQSHLLKKNLDQLLTMQKSSNDDFAKEMSDKLNNKLAIVYGSLEIIKMNLRVDQNVSPEVLLESLDRSIQASMLLANEIKRLVKQVRGDAV
jgi:GAF domain-containing protein